MTGPGVEALTLKSGLCFANQPHLPHPPHSEAMQYCKHVLYCSSIEMPIQSLKVFACYCPSEGYDHVVLTVSLPKRMSTYGMASIICFL